MRPSFGVLVLGAVLVSFQAWATNGAQCVLDELTGMHIHRDNPAVEKEVAELGKILKPGGAKHSPPKNQECGEDCWAQTLATTAESTGLRETGVEHKVSPEYLQDWQIYYMFKDKLAYYKKLALELKDPTVSAATKKKIREVYNVGAEHSFSKPATTEHDGHYYVR
jgi:hypothetical protein